MLQVDGTGHTSPEEDGDEDCDDEEEEEKDGVDDGQVEEVSFYKSFEKKRHSSFTFAKHANYMLFFSPRGRERWMLALSFFHILSNPQA